MQCHDTYLLSHFPSWEGLPFPVQVTTGLASPWLTWRCPVSCVLAPGLCFRSGPALARYLAAPQGLGFQLTRCSSSPQTAVTKKRTMTKKIFSVLSCDQFFQCSFQTSYGSTTDCIPQTGNENGSDPSVEEWFISNKYLLPAVARTPILKE